MREIIAQDNRVVALCGGRIKHRKSGRIVSIDLVDVIRLRNGKIVEFIEYFDSATILELAKRRPKKAGTLRSAARGAP